MFKNNDKTTLTCINLINRRKEKIDFNLSFPIKDINFVIPNDIIQMSIFEGHEDQQIYGYEVCNIYIGNVITLKNLLESDNSNYNLDIINNISNLDDKLVYYIDDNGKYIVYAKINQGDIVLKNCDELKVILIEISKCFQNIQKNIQNIRGYSYSDKGIKNIKVKCKKL